MGSDCPLPPQVPILEASQTRAPVSRQPAPEREGLPGPRRGSPQTSGHIPPPPGSCSRSSIGPAGAEAFQSFSRFWIQPRDLHSLPGVVPGRVSTLQAERQLPNSSSRASLASCPGSDANHRALWIIVLESETYAGTHLVGTCPGPGPELGHSHRPRLSLLAGT